MSDYISKSALLEQLIGIDDEIVKGCIGVIQTQPTVDEKEIIRKTVERIVERLEDKKNRPYLAWDDNDSVYKRIIEFVKEECGISE